MRIQKNTEVDRAETWCNETRGEIEIEEAVECARRVEAGE